MTEARFYIKDRPLLDKPFPLKGVGLPNVYLLNGVTVENDPDYGDLVSIENIEELYRAIGLHIIESGPQMTGAEFRFLRKQMNLTQVELGALLSVSSQTIANYEKAHVEGLGAADLAIRMMYLLHILPPESRAVLMKQIFEFEAAKRKRARRLPEMPRRQIVGKWKERYEGTCLAA